jgi:hypothetical protein
MKFVLIRKALAKINFPNTRGARQTALAKNFANGSVRTLQIFESGGARRGE